MSWSGRCQHLLLGFEPVAPVVAVRAAARLPFLVGKAGDHRRPIIVRRCFHAAIRLLSTVTLLFRVVGGIGAGTAADRWGRKGPILFSIAWYTLFAFLSGQSTSYVMLFAFRGLFGIGMGGMWAAGMPLALEHWPSRLRGLGSGLLQGGYSVGFLLSSLVYQFGYPFVNDDINWGWRIMLWAGVIPAIVVFVVMWTVPESPVWLEQQRRLAASGQRARISLARLFDRDLRPVTLHTSLLMGAPRCSATGGRSGRCWCGPAPTRPGASPRKP